VWACRAVALAKAGLWLNSIAMPYFRTQDNCSLYYETEGFETSGPVAVFLNGTMLTTVYWKTLASMFKDRFRVLMYDARAQGQSDIGEQAVSLDIHAGDLAALLEHVEVKRAHLVGFSHGAKVALVCAARFPGLVDRLVLCSISTTLSSRARLMMRSWLKILNGAGLEAMAWVALPVVFGEEFLAKQKRILPTIVKAITTRNSEAALTAHLEAVLNYPPLAEMVHSVDVPSLVISSSDDPLVTEQGVRQLASLFNGRHEHIAGAGHSVPAEAPELFGEIVSEFLGEA